MHPDETHVWLLCCALLIGPPAGAVNSARLIASHNLIEIAAPKSDPSDRLLTQASLDRQIQRVLENPEFNWREPYSPARNSKQKSLLDQLVSSMREMLISVGKTLNRLWKSLLKTFDFKHPFAESPRPDSRLPSGIFNALTYLFWALLGATLILTALRLRKLRATVRLRPVVPPPIPDLADEGTAANLLPDDEWSALARRKIAAGEFRQALRALFLAILALLASRRFIAIERWKSNSDYEKELRRKAAPRSDLLTLFARSRLGFERCWYGADNITLADLENYNGIYERIKHAATDNL